CLAKSVDRARADIAVDDTKRTEDEKRELRLALARRLSLPLTGIAAGRDRLRHENLAHPGNGWAGSTPRSTRTQPQNARAAPAGGQPAMQAPHGGVATG